MTVQEQEAVIGELEGIVSKKYVMTHIFERIKSSLDTFPYEADRDTLPAAVVMPGSTDEVSRIMRYAAAARVPVFVRGSGTSFLGASRYHVPGVVLSTRRLDSIELFEDYGYFECGPGAICAHVEEALKPGGFFLPAAPGSRLIASMGGIIANNTSAHIVDTSIGKPGDYVLGVEAVLPNGHIIETGTKGLRRAAGTDLTKFFVGGDGLFGVVTRIRMRLVPQFERAFGFAVYRNLDSVARAVQRMYMERRPAPLFMEFMDERSSAIGYGLKGLEPPQGSVVLFVTHGESKEEASRKAREIMRSLETEHPADKGLVDDPHLWEKLWSAREVIGSFLMQQSGNQWSSAEVVANLKDLPECMRDAAAFNTGLPVLGRLDLYVFGHIGGLTMHPGVIIPKEWDNETKHRAIDEKFEREGELNLKYGTCGGEWGQFSKRTPFFIRRYGPHAYGLMRDLKRAVDAENILNPGVLEGYR